ncbi:MAG: DNA mismatch repair protein MutS [Bacteroidales bacterium]|jgi:DNA mismatch repair protein MutS|nr:DNA mismatch repair protein MutS [Bacteroidales bacterium]
MLKQKEIAETPLMKQYNAIKVKYPDAMLLFRVGDFYETFGEDAIRASNILGIVLTRRANGVATYIELAGFPHHSLDLYLPKLVKAGLRVAICDQLEDPKLTKTIVKRGVTELVTPGVSYNDKILEQKENNFLAGLHLEAKTSGISFLDISTGEFYVAQGNMEYIDKLIQSFRPSEVIIQKNRRQQFTELFGNKFYINTFDDWVFTPDFAHDLLLKQFGTASLKGFGVENLEIGLIAAGAALHYLAETQHDKVQHICKLSRIEEDHYVWLDRFTIRNLELLSSANEQAKTLLDVLDQTVSPMGSRQLRRWIILPLKNRQPIEERLDTVEFFTRHPETSDQLHHHFQQIGDLERLISKVAVARVNPREMIWLKRALDSIEAVKQVCEASKNEGLLKIGDQLNGCALVRERIEREINPEPPALAIKGNIIREGVNKELDELREMAFSGKDYLVQIQQREIERTGISSLKIGYTNVFGYYLEVTNVHKEKVPQEWHRKQTLVNAERYITDELKSYEEKILHAEEKMLELELTLYNDLILFLADYIRPVQLNATLIARLDVLVSFSISAIKYRYTRPELNDSFILDIKDGRHPVIERQMKPGEEYIANDVYLDDKSQQIIILTGPNMSGKSALLRQTALIVLMAQMGSFVPAAEARLGIIDKIFTRVGASDNISSGESTFMVEMNETASILNNISNRSLIFLDEIGRGTSTYDGISIAWAIAEFLHQHPLFKPRVLFATHYHELNEMTIRMPRIKNYHVAVKEIQNKVIFLRKLLPGGSEHSFGIHVAKMAGMPRSVLERAGELLVQLEEAHDAEEIGKQMQDAGYRIQDKKKKSGRSLSNIQHPASGVQLSFIQLDDPLLQQIKEDILNTEINTLTPIEALMKLNEIKKLLEKK